MPAQRTNTEAQGRKKDQLALPTPPTADPPPVGGDGGTSNLVRVTVNLTPKAHADLVKLNGATGLSKTDVINRALQVYSLVEDLLDRGGGSIVVQHADGQTERIYVL
jgi:hypothetical protein